MKRINTIFAGLLLLVVVLPGYSQQVKDFTLKDVVSGNTFSLSQHQSAKAVVLLFTNNSCPFSTLYESRIMDMAKQYQTRNFKFVLVNPNADTAEGETTADMIKKSNTAMEGLPYLADGDQSLARAFGIAKIPEVVVIVHGPGGFKVAYQGAIDNNPQLPHSVTKSYLEDALKSVGDNKSPDPASTRSVGCNLKSTH